MSKGKKDKEAPHSNEEIELASLLAPCVKGDIFTCEYYLEVKPVYGMFEKMKGTPILKLPLTIYSDMFKDYVTMKPEVQNWEPTVYD
jgi:hypothetical protein